MAKDGTKTVITLGNDRSWAADAVVAVMNEHPVFSFFKFTSVPSGDGIAIVADGRWSLPGNERPALNTMQTWIDGYITGRIGASPSAA
jgi:hypothetical protein